MSRARAAACWPGRPVEAAVVAPLPVAEMPGMRDLVPHGEIVIASLRPSFWFIVLKPMWRLVSVAAVSGLGAAAGWGGWAAIDPWIALAVGLGAVSMLVLYTLADWLTRMYLLTDRRVMRVSGIVRQVVFDAPLPAVQNVVLYRSVRERATGLGTVVFSTAGGAGGEFSWFMIDRPVEVVRLVRETLSRYGHLGPGQVKLKPHAGDPGPAGGAEVAS
ncbi:MAG: PH domain-containing protein [Phycisphaeraceae bacterium]|nr:PH domain-containing protein [Phycisphaeraceae bacterium]